jgi:hypothetical protein
MIQDVHWRACHLQAKTTPRDGHPWPQSVHDSLGPAAQVLDGYSTWLTLSADLRVRYLRREVANPEADRTKP